MSIIPNALHIPFEITSKIFHLCIPVGKRSRPSLDQAPISISQVCQQWRSISLANPGLWSSIAVEMYCDDDYGLSLLFDIPGKRVEEEPSSKLLNLWFTRAETHRLSLSANCMGDSIPPWFLDAISVYAPRCSDIEIRRRPYYRVLEAQGPGPFPLLQHLTIRLVVERNLAHILPPLFQPAPDLKMLRLLGHFIPKSHISIGPVGLTDLEVGGWLAFPECTPIFTDFPHLRRSHYPSSTFKLECLRLGHSVEMLHLLTVPNLRSLTISIGDEAIAELLSPFLLTLQGQLTELVLNIWGTVSNVALYPCLDAVPKLVTLKLRFRDPTHPSYDLPPLPDLRTSNVEGPPDFYQSILAMLSGRNLSRLEFYLYEANNEVEHASSARGPDVAAFAAFNAYAQQGCIVWVTTPTLAWPEDRDDANSADYAEYKTKHIHLPELSFDFQDSIVTPGCCV
ncbi:hypothetical protein B0H13DRAFT_2155558 [Mycena leptocephala]|nr:hypothetical protein B0H13DRAFT_2155558 [Mycena leptocephala]